MLVESNITIPAANGGGRGGKYPWAQMQVGDSFLVAQAKIATICNAVSSRKKHNHPERYTARTVDGGVRVWRVA